MLKTAMAGNASCLFDLTGGDVSKRTRVVGGLLVRGTDRSEQGDVSCLLHDACFIIRQYRAPATAVSYNPALECVVGSHPSVRPPPKLAFANQLTQELSLSTYDAMPNRCRFAPPPIPYRRPGYARPTRRSPPRRPRLRCRGRHRKTRTASARSSPNG